ncbi:hypothetical protein GF325_10400 [Candidatus Bathyarchaeota archaeon]|nr:hypothetical protein [Candidatus Bathyarchaeota archaeon]
MQVLSMVARDSRRRLVLSTDIGFDPDDFIALNLCLANPRFDLVGILVEPGSRDQVGLVHSILKFNNREEIPVASNKDSHVHHMGFVSRLHARCVDNLGVPLVAQETSHDDRELLEGCLLKDPRTCLVTIGPPIIVPRWIEYSIESTIIPVSYSMGGFHGGYHSGKICLSQEYNFGRDPASAVKLVNAKRITRRVMVSKNVTHHVFYTPFLHEHVGKVARESPAHAMIWHLMGGSSLRDPASLQMLHDPLTVMVSLDESIVTLREVQLVEQDGRWGSIDMAGTGCFITIGGDGAVDLDRFHEMLLSF